jgi:hypothetical protein
MFTIETKESPRGKWHRSRFAKPMTFSDAQEFAELMLEHGSCCAARVVQWS